MTTVYLIGGAWAVFLFGFVFGMGMKALFTMNGEDEW